MELQKWLELEANLTGNKLRLAIDLCSSNLVESMADMRNQYEEGNLYELFPQLVLRKAIEKALNGSGSKLVSQQTSHLADPQPTQAKSSRPATNNDSKGTDLPAGRVYAAFISHKKVRDTARSVTKVLDRLTPSLLSQDPFEVRGFERDTIHPTERYVLC